MGSARTGSNPVARASFFVNFYLYLKSQRAIYILTYDDSTVNELGIWLRNIRSRAPKAPVLLICDKTTTSGTSNAKKVDFHLSTLYDHLHISSYTMAEKDKVRESFLNLVDNFKIDGVKVTEELIPKSYLDLERLLMSISEALRIKTDQLLGRKKRYSLCFSTDSLDSIEYDLDRSRQIFEGTVPILTRVQIGNLCQEYEIELEDIELESALLFLARVGIILHFDDTRAGLNELFFIDPTWVCRTISDIVLSDEVKDFVEESGFITNDKLIELVLKRRNIPESNYSHIMRMIEVLEIIIEDAQQRYLVPSHLPSGKFGYKKSPIESLTQRLYGFSSLPIEFWPRLISRFMNFSCGETSIWDGVDIDARKEGLKVTLNDGTRLIIQSRSKVHMKDSIDSKLYEELTWCGSDCPEHNISTTDINAWIEITITMTGPNSNVIFGDCIDAVDNLIQEWYPALVENFMPLVFIFASYYNDDKRVVIPLNTLLRCCGYSPHAINCSKQVKQSSNQNESNFTCPITGQTYPVAFLAPDIELKDMNSELQIDEKDIEKQKMLGAGGFAAVFKGIYKNEQEVALKTFSSSLDNSVLPYKNLRKELKVLLKIKHKSIVSCLGFTVKPDPTLVIEYAPEGSLETLLENSVTYPLCNELKFKIIYQVGEGIEYLHEQNIVYRDLKFGNVLIFSRDPTSTVVAKIADYGIAEHLTPMGTSGYSGTAGYSAPEVVKIRLNQNLGTAAYAKKVDIFSFGLMVHELITEQIPWFADHQRTQTNSEPDRLVMMGLVPLPFTDLGCSSWPLMEVIVETSTSYYPNDRPTITNILQLMKKPLPQALRCIIPIQTNSPIQDSVLFKVAELKKLRRNSTHLNNERSRTASTSSLSDLVDSGEHQTDARFPSSIVDHHAKQRFEGNVARKRSKIRQISKTNTKLVRNEKAIKEDINRRLDWQAWLILANSDVPTNSPIESRRESIIGSYNGFGRRAVTAIRKRTGSWHIKKHVIDVYEFDWQSIRKHGNIQVDANHALCMVNMSDSKMGNLTCVGTRQGCIDIYDSKQWTIFRSQRVVPNTPILHIAVHTPSQVLTPAGSRASLRRRQSLPSILGQTPPKSGNKTKIFIGLPDGKFYWNYVARILEGDTQEKWVQIRVHRNETVNRLIVKNDKIFTLSGRATIASYNILQTNVQFDKMEHYDDLKYVDMTICHQIFALHEKRRKIDVICRRTMTPVQQISLDQLVPGQPRRSCLAITTIASVHNTIWLGTSNGTLMTIRDYIKPDKQYIVEDTFKPFYGPIIKIKTSRTSNKDGECVMVIGKRYVPPLHQFALFDDVYNFDQATKEEKQCALIFDANIGL